MNDIFPSVQVFRDQASLHCRIINRKILFNINIIGFHGKAFELFMAGYEPQILQALVHIAIQLSSVQRTDVLQSSTGPWGVGKACHIHYRI